MDQARSQIDRITPQGLVTTFNMLTPSARPNRITVGPSDMNPAALWFTETDANKIGEITTAGVVSEFTVPTAASGLNSITLGPSNNIWLTEQTVDQLGMVTGI
mgnify:CR=1 FL=1